MAQVTESAPVMEGVFNDIPARACWVYLTEPRRDKKTGELGRAYEMTAVIDPADRFWQRREKSVRQAALDCLQNKFGTKAQFGKTYRSPFKESHDNEDLIKYPYYEGKIVLALKSYDRPVPVTDFENIAIPHNLIKKEIYSGCVVIPTFGFYNYDNESKGVTGALMCVRKLANATPFKGSINPDQAYKGVDMTQYNVDDNGMWGDDPDAQASEVGSL